MRVTMRVCGLVAAFACSLYGCGGGEGRGDDDRPTCGDGFCDPGDCASDCVVCGDGVCDGTENTASCPGDCPAAPVCGDGACNGTENTASCPSDCPANPLCGDGACNGSETTTSCPMDCPATWTCDPSFYNAQDGCDCDCGIPDPDCADPNAALFNCSGTAPYCTAAGTCDDYCIGVPLTGSCSDATTVQYCMTSELPGVLPVVETFTCPSGYSCIAGPDGAICDAPGVCDPGRTYCSDSVTLQTCTGGAWVPSTCPAAPLPPPACGDPRCAYSWCGTPNEGACPVAWLGTGDGCDCGCQSDDADCTASGPGVCAPNPGMSAACVPGTPAATITGRLQYQFRPRNAGLTNFGAPVVANAPAIIAAVIDGPTVLGTAYTGADGSFAVNVYAAPSPSAYVLFLPYAEYADGVPVLAIGKATAPCRLDMPCSEYGLSDGLWTYYTAPLAGATDVGTLLITEANGSGAIFIYEWTLFGQSRLVALYPDVPRLKSLLVTWEPDVAWVCGSCFNGIPATMAGRAFESWIAITGTTATPQHWSSSVLAHELGHYAMRWFSRAPGEGGPHSVFSSSSPGLAWSEGWAAYFGQTTLSAGGLEPVYFDKQGGSAWWVNLEALSNSYGMLFEFPDPSGTLAQYLNEFVVSAMLWDLADSTPAEDMTTLADAPLSAGFHAARLVGPFNRGYSTVDLVDFLDSLRCYGYATAVDIDGVVLTAFGFPYDEAPLCPP